MFTEMMRRLMTSAAFAPEGTGGETLLGGGGGDAAAVAAAAAKAAADAAAAGGGDAAKAAADKAAADKATADKAASDKALADARKAGADGWRDTITDEKLKNVASRIGSPSDAMKTIVDLQTLASSRIKVPDDKATPEERASFNKAIGVPDKVEGYEYRIEIPEGKTSAEMQIGDKKVEVTANDKAMVDALLPALHKAGAPKSVVKAALDIALDLNAQLREAATTQIENTRSEHQKSLMKEYPGKDYTALVNTASTAAKALGGEALIDLLETVPVGKGMLGDHPVMVKLLAAVAPYLSSEGTVLLGNTDETRKSAQEELNALNAKVLVGSPEYKAPAHQQKLKALYEKTGGGAPIVGAGGRTL